MTLPPVFGHGAALSIPFLVAVISGCTASPQNPPGGTCAVPQARSPAHHNTFYHHDNLGAIEAVLPEWGRAEGFTLTSLEGYKAAGFVLR